MITQWKKPPLMKASVLIVGGGLAGLALARKLQSAGCKWQLLESRDRWGGRILTQHVDGQGYDLGPSWFWPGQPRIDALLNELQLERFNQAYQGDLMFQDESGKAHRGQGMASMQGSWRLVGGLGQLIDELVNSLPNERLHLNTSVSSLTYNDQTLEISTTSGNTSSSKSFKAEHVVLAIPPRVATNLTFTPALPEKSLQAARQIPTWMAGHAKAVATYKQPFWLEQGLSGDAMSRLGPLVEIHDASPSQGGPYALFGFIGTPPSSRLGNSETLETAIRQQLGILFGDEGAYPEQLMIKDWAFDSNTAIDLDSEGLRHHPAYGRVNDLRQLWNGRLHFGSTEMGAQFGGFLEGALEVAYELSEVLASQ